MYTGNNTKIITITNSDRFLSAVTALRGFPRTEDRTEIVVWTKNKRLLTLTWPETIVFVIIIVTYNTSLANDLRGSFRRITILSYVCILLVRDRAGGASSIPTKWRVLRATVDVETLHLIHFIRTSPGWADQRRGRIAVSFRARARVRRGARRRQPPPPPPTVRHSVITVSRRIRPGNGTRTHARAPPTRRVRNASSEITSRASLQTFAPHRKRVKRTRNTGLLSFFFFA